MRVRVGCRLRLRRTRQHGHDAAAAASRASPARRSSRGRRRDAAGLPSRPKSSGRCKLHRAAHAAARELAVRRRVPLGVQGAGDGVRRGARVPAGRRGAHASTGTSPRACGEPFVKRYIEERELTVMLAVDLSGSAQFGTRQRFKSELAIGAGRGARDGGDPQQRPRRRAAVHRSRRARRAARGRGAGTRCASSATCSCTSRWARAPTSAARWST